MKKKLSCLLIVTMLFAMSPVLAFAGQGQDSKYELGSWQHYKAEYGALVETYAKVNPKHEDYAIFAAELGVIKDKIESLFGTSFATENDANEDGVGGLVGESIAADAELVATDPEAETYPVTGRDIHDVYTAAYDKLYVTPLEIITIGNNIEDSIEDNSPSEYVNGRVAQWYSIVSLWNVPELFNITGGWLSTPEQAVIDAAATHVVNVGECINFADDHRNGIQNPLQASSTPSQHFKKEGCIYATQTVPTDRANLLISSGVLDIAKAYIAEKAEYAKAFANITRGNIFEEENQVHLLRAIRVLSVHSEQKIVADIFIASVEANAAKYKDVTDARGVVTPGLLSAAKTDLNGRISPLKDSLVVAANVTFNDDIIDETIVDDVTDETITGNVVDKEVKDVIEKKVKELNREVLDIVAQDETLAVSSNPLPLIGFVPGEIVTENQEVTLVPASDTPKSIGSPESTYSPLWIWGLVADLFAFVVVFLIILWRRKQRINAGEDIF
jgi:hypothetical protein